MDRSDWSGERSVLIGRAPTNQDAEFLAAVKKEPFDWSGERSILIGRTPTNQDAKFVLATKRSALIGRANEAFRLVGHRPIRTRSLSGCQKGAFRLAERTKRSDWSGTDQSGRRVLSSCQKEPSDWSEGTERFDWSVLDQLGPIKNSAS